MSADVGEAGGRGGEEGEYPEEVQRALEGLPQSFKDALAGAPQEARDALAGFEGGSDAEGSQGLDLESALAGAPVDAKEILARLPEGVVEGLEGVEVSEGQPFALVDTQITGGPRHKLEVRAGRCRRGRDSRLRGGQGP